MKRMVTLLLSVLLTFTLAIPALAGSLDSEIATATRFLQVKGILQGDASGNLQLNKTLTRAELAVILARLTVNQEHLMAEKTYYSNQCEFTDVPDWAKVYVGYCASRHYVDGYGNGRYNPNGLVTPQAACTVLLRACGNLVPFEWSYETALDAAVQYGIAPKEALQEQHITRGNMAILLYRTADKLGFFSMDIDEKPSSTGPVPSGSPLTRNADGSINIPSDGSRYVPQAGDVIRCDDGTNYTITDVSRYDKSMFAEGPLPPLPTPTCDWSQFPEIEWPDAEVRHFNDEDGDYIFVRNLYETRRMLYTVYNAIGDNPNTWKDGKLVLRDDGTPMVKLYVEIPYGEEYSSFWPWRDSELTKDFQTLPVSKYYMEAWDVYSDGIFLYTEYAVY